jgi:hypothetical protein
MIVAVAITLLLIVLYLLLPGIFIFSILQTRFHQIPNQLLLLTGLSIPPALHAVLLFYLLWFIPHLPDEFYLGFILIPYFIAFLYYKLNIAKIKQSLALVQLKTNSKPLNWMLIAGVFAWIFWCFYKIILLPVEGHDLYEYLIQAEQFWKNKAFTFESFRQHKNNFVYVGLHGFAFPLQHTFSQMAYELVNIRADLFIKFISLYYSLLLFLFGFYYTQQYSAIAAWLFSLLFILPIGNFTLLTSIHIDTFRITLLVIFLYFFYQTLIFKSKDFILITAFIGGLQSYIHSLNFIISGFVLIILLLTLKQPWHFKWRIIIPTLMIYLLFGSLHYMLDTLIGTGWIFKQIHFY